MSDSVPLGCSTIRSVRGSTDKERTFRYSTIRERERRGVTHYSYGEGALAHSTAFSYLFERGAAIDLEAHLPSKGEARRGSTAKERDLEAHPSDG